MTPPRFRTISIGGATLDVFVRMSKKSFRELDGKNMLAVPLGEKIRILDPTESAGGGAANTSVGFSRLGCRSFFGGVLASDAWGDVLRRALETEGVAISPSTVIQGENSSFSLVLLSPSGERVIFTDPGTNTHIADPLLDTAAVEQADLLYLTSLQEESREIEDDLLAILKRPGNPRFTWNPGGNQIAKGMGDPMTRNLLAAAHLLLLNREEALAFTGKPTSEEAIRVLHAAGAQVVCITDGGKGVLATDGKKIYRCPAIQATEVIDATGAGDAFGCAVSWALMSEEDLPTAMKTGTMNATSVVSAIGAQKGLLTDTQIRDRLKRSDLRVESEPF